MGALARSSESGGSAAFHSGGRNDHLDGGEREGFLYDELGDD